VRESVVMDDLHPTLKKDIENLAEQLEAATGQ
jgi:hypothetical protein